MLLGLGTAFAGLVPALAPLYGVLSAASAALTGLLDRWAVWISAKPGAGIYFDTAYAAIVCLVLILLGWLAFHWRVRLRVAGPCILLAAAVSIGLGNALSRDVVHIDLVGSANAPAVVVTGAELLPRTQWKTSLPDGACRLWSLWQTCVQTLKRPVHWKQSGHFRQQKWR